MSPLESITSLQNARVKQVVRLSGRRTRDQLQQTVVEGIRESQRALDSGIIPVEAFVCGEYLVSHEAGKLREQLFALNELHSTHVFEVTPAVYDKMAYRGGSGGVILVIPILSRSLDTVALDNNSLLVVVDGAEKPGNLGAILRTADAAGVSAILLTGPADGRTDIQNPNVIRASLGAYFSVPVVSTSRESALQWLNDNSVFVVATSPLADVSYADVAYEGATAIVMGSEAEGLSDKWLESVDKTVYIPMLGKVDSLNLSAATAVLVYEVVRQRMLRASRTL